MAYTAGAAQVVVTPDFRSFHVKIGEQLDSEDATFAKAGERWGKLAGDSFKAGFGKINPQVTPKVDDAGAKTELDGLTRDRDTTVKTKVDDDAAKVSLAELVKTRTATVKVKVSGVQKAAKSVAESFADLKIPALGAAAIGLGPSALGAGAAALGGGLALGAAAASVGAFAAIAVPMFAKVTKAQTALTTATADYAKATTKAQKAAALKAEAAATDGLTSSEKKLAIELANLKTGWSRLSDAEEPVVGRALVPWFTAASESLRFLPSLINPAATAIGQLGSEAQKNLQAPFWGTFFRSVGDVGGPAVRDFGGALGYLGDAAAHLFVTFAPDIAKLPPLIDKWAASFDTWAKSVSRAGFDKWLSGVFSHQNLSTLQGDLSSLGTVFGNVATATEQMSPAAFTGLSNVLSILAKLTPTQIEALALIYGGSKVAGNVSSLAGLLGSLGGLGSGKSKGKTSTSEEGESSSSGLGIGGLLSKGLIGLSVAGGVESLLSGISSGPGGKNWLDNPFGTNGKNSANPSGWNSFSQAGKNIKNWTVNDPANWATTGWSEAYTHFQRDFAGHITSWFTTTFPSFFTQAIPGAWSWAYTGFMRNIGSPVAGFFTRTLPSFFSGIGSGLSGVGSAFSREGSQIARSISSGFSTAWTSTSGAISGAFTATKGWVTGAFRTAGTWLSGAGHSIATGLGTAYQATSGWVSGVASRAYGWVTSQFSRAGSWLSGAGHNIAVGLGDGYSAVSGWVSGVAGRAHGWVTGQFSRAGGWLSGAGHNIATGLGDGYASVSGWISGVASRAYGWVTGAFGGAGSWLYGIGQSIMSGLSAGLNSAIGGVESVLNWVTAHIPSWKGPPSYDAVLLRPAGQLIMGGLADSLASGIPGVRSVLGQATAAVGAGLNVPAVSGASLPRVRGTDGAAIRISIDGGSDPLVQALVRSMRAEIGGKYGGSVQAALGKR